VRIDVGGQKLHPLGRSPRYLERWRLFVLRHLVRWRRDMLRLELAIVVQRPGDRYMYDELAAVAI
jgi:hypothetical protein